MWLLMKVSKGELRIKVLCPWSKCQILYFNNKIMLSAVAPEVTIVSDKKPQPGLKYGRIKRAPKLVLKKEKSSDSSSSSSDNGEDSSCGEDEGMKTSRVNPSSLVLVSRCGQWRHDGGGERRGGQEGGLHPGQARQGGEGQAQSGQVSCDWLRAGHVTRCWCQAAGGGDELQQLGPDPRDAAEPGHPAGGGGHRHDGYPGQPPAVCRVQGAWYCVLQGHLVGRRRGKPMKSTTIDVQTYSVGGSFLRLEQVTADNWYLHCLHICAERWHV